MQDYRRRPDAEFGGLTKFRRSRFLNDVLKKNSISRPKILMTFCLVIDHVFQIFHISLLYEMSYITVSSQEKPLFQKIIPWWHLYFTLFVLSHASDNTTQNIPHLKFWGDSHPRSPLMCRALPGARKKGKPRMRWIDIMEKWAEMSFDKLLMEMTSRRWALIIYGRPQGELTPSPSTDDVMRPPEPDPFPSTLTS